MSPRQRLLRLVNWALGLSVFTLVVLVGAFVICPMTSHAIIWAETPEVRVSRPPDTAPQAEKDAWETRYIETYRIASGATGRAFLIATLYVGVPTSTLLIVVCILLYRVRRHLRRGV